MLDSVVASLEHAPIPHDAMQINARCVAGAIARVPPGGVLLPLVIGLAACLPVLWALTITPLGPAVARVLSGLVAVTVAFVVSKRLTAREYVRTVRRAILDADWSNPAPLSLVASEVRRRAEQTAASSTNNNATRIRAFAEQIERDPVVRAWFAAVWLARAAGTNRPALEPEGPSAPFRRVLPE